MTFTKNFSVRAHSAAHSSSHGPGNSVHGLCSGVSAAILTGGSVDKALDEMQKAHEMDKMYHRSMSYRTQRVNKRRKLFELHAKHQEELIIINIRKT